MFPLPSTGDVTPLLEPGFAEAHRPAPYGLGGIRFVAAYTHCDPPEPPAVVPSVVRREVVITVTPRMHLGRRWLLIVLQHAKLTAFTPLVPLQHVRRLKELLVGRRRALVAFPNPGESILPYEEAVHLWVPLDGMVVVDIDDVPPLTPKPNSD